ncbi:MAG: glycosyltransferase family 39 protein [Acidobacteria bacterium]|nr:glycosyltransferase family 39 protein [Acidobacteriota bacterium]
MLGTLSRLIPVGVFLFYLHYTSFDLGWSDSYGYVTVAHRLARFEFAACETTLESLGIGGDGIVSTPLAYSFINGRSVPVYPFGAPAMMAPLVWILGPRGPFYLPPLMGALCFVLLYRIGKEIAGRATGYAAAGLGLAWPPLFSFATIAMSDVVGAFFILLATMSLLKSRGRPLFATGAGLAIGMAFLVRPNLSLFVVPAALYLLCERRARRILDVAFGFLPAFLLQLWVHTAYYRPASLEGSYGAQTSLFTIHEFWRVAGAQLHWLVQFGMLSLLPFIGWAMVTPRLSASSKTLVSAWFLVLLTFYGFYPAWHVWLLSRFLLPAHLLLLVVAAVGLVDAARHCRTALLVRGAVPAIVILSIVNNALFLHDHDAYRIRVAWRTIARTAKTVKKHTGERSLVFAYSFSGFLRYYEGVRTANLEAGPEACERTIAACSSKGVPVFALIEKGGREREMFEGLASSRGAVRIAEVFGWVLYELAPVEMKAGALAVTRS